MHKYEIKINGIGLVAFALLFFLTNIHWMVCWLIASIIAFLVFFHDMMRGDHLAVSTVEDSLIMTGIEIESD